MASTDCPGIAKAVEELGLDVKVVGVGTPNSFKPYVMSGTITKVKLWDPKVSGYVMCKLAADILAGEDIGDGEDIPAGSGTAGDRRHRLRKGHRHGTPHRAGDSNKAGSGGLTLCTKSFNLS